MTQPQTRFDAIVIGGGHNGLSAAITLARKGKSVCVVERSLHLGGMMAPEYGLAHTLYNLRPMVMRSLGLQLDLRTLPTVSLCPDGDHVVIEGSRARMFDGSPHPKATEFAKLHRRLVRFAGLLETIALNTPPKLSGGLTDPETLGEMIRLGRLGLGIKALGKTEMQEFLRVLLTNVHDLVVDELGDGPLAGSLSADAVRGGFAGPYAPGTVFTLLYRLGAGGNVSVPRAGMAAVARAFEDAATRAGCSIKCGSAVTRVLVHGDQAAGVELADGSVLEARAVLSSAGPAQTVALTGPEHFDIEATRRVRSIRAKGTAAKVNFQLKGKPSFAGLPDDLRGGRLLIAPTSAGVERAFNPVKYGEVSEDLTLEMVLPQIDAPEEEQSLSVIAGFVPLEHAAGWTDEAREALGALVQRRIEAFAPGFASLVQSREVFTPADIEARTRAPGGHWHHGEMGLDQILTVRPTNGMAHYSMGVQGLYLCGAAAHPGGDISGLPGRNSALQALKDGAV